MPKKSRPNPNRSNQKQMETAANGGKTENNPLTPRQQSALPIIAAAPTFAQAARSAGIGETTLRRWINNETFSAELIRQRDETAALTRQEIQGLMFRSIAVIAETMDAPDPAIRLRAARYGLSFAARLAETETLTAELRDLKELVAAIPQTNQPTQMPKQ